MTFAEIALLGASMQILLMIIKLALSSLTEFEDEEKGSSAQKKLKIKPPP